MKRIHRGQKGFTLIELLIVIAILGIIAAVVALNIGGFFGQGRLQAANTEAHQVQTAVIAFMADSGATGGTATGSVGPNATMEHNGYEVHHYLMNPGQLQAVYDIDAGAIEGATTIEGSQWGVSPGSPEAGAGTTPNIWFVNGLWVGEDPG